MRLLLILILGIGSGELAYGDCQADMQAIDQAAAAAKAHGIEAAASSNAAAASGAAASAGTAINPNAGASSAAAGQCSAGLQQGIDNIAKDLAAAQKPTCQNQTSDQTEEQKCAQCRQKKAAAIKEIKGTGDQVAAGNKDCQKSQQGSDETKKQSDQGGMPQMPQSGSGSEPKKDDALDDLKNSLANQNPSTNSSACSKPDSYNNPDCNDKVVDECSKGTGKNCEQFTFRYCKPQSSGGTGEGIGSSYCKKEVAKNFCKEEGRNQCPTCKQQVLQESDACKGKGSLCVSASKEQQLKDAKANCPSDPIFTDPKNAITTASVGGDSGAAGGGGGGGSLGGSSTGALPADAKSSAVGEEANRKNLDISPSSGGGFSGYGSGGSASTDSSDSPFKFGALGLKGKGSAGAGATAGSAGGGGNMLTPEVHGRTSKSIFMMSSEVYVDRCQRDLIRNCSPTGD